MDFTVPELGENVMTGDVVRVLVNVGDTLAKDQPVLELETDKATIEVPSTLVGKVTAVLVKPGDKVKVGQVIATVDVAASGSGATPAVASSAAAPAAVVAPPAPAAPAPAAPAARVAASAADRPLAEVVSISRAPRPAVEAAPPPAPARPVAPAAPSVRRVARELGIDINDVTGSGPAGRISADDISAHARALVTAAHGGGVARRAAPALPDFGKWGDVERQAMSNVRRKTAEHLAEAWAQIPHVTQCDKADVTELEALRARYGGRAEAAGGKLTLTAIAMRIIASALKVFPQFNASVDEPRGEIVYKKYVHIGVAVDTDRGLLVPVVRNVDRKNIVQIAVELAQAAERARTRKTSLDELQGGCFTITNLGGIGGTYFTPIVNHPEVAILGISRASTEPVHVDGAFQPRLRLPLSLSYDHRVIDGADGIRFLRWVVEAFEHPFLLSLEG